MSELLSIVLNALKGFLGVLRLCSLKKFTESWERQTKTVPNKEKILQYGSIGRITQFFCKGEFCGEKNSPRWAIRAPNQKERAI